MLAPAVLDPGGWPFTYPLSRHQLVLADSQWEMLERAQHSPQTAMVVRFVQDPDTRSHPKPLMTMSMDGDTQLVTMPGVVDLRPEWSNGVFDEHWHRFPTVDGRLYHRSPITDTYDLGPVEGYRIWNLWPIEDYEIDYVHEAVQSWEEEELDPLQVVYAVDNGDVDVCDVVPGDPAGHTHTGDPEWYRCEDGEGYLEEQRQLLFRLDDDGMTVPLSLDPIRLDDTLQGAWDFLVVSSEANTHRAMNAVPPWQREHVLRTERRYSPWLWSS